MLNKHFFKTLFIFLLIIASGVLLILAVDYTDQEELAPAETENIDS